MSDNGKSKGGAMIPVGVERVLYLAASDEAFCGELQADAEAAVRARGLCLDRGELALLRAIPPSLLAANARGLDPSPENQRRRSFLRVVAASAATVVAADMLGGCKTLADTGARPDWDQGVKPDKGTDRSSDGPAADKAAPDQSPAADGKVPAPEGGGGFDLATNGIRPHG